MDRRPLAAGALARLRLALWSLVLIVAVPLTTVVLTASQLLSRYDAISYGGHASHVRRWIPRRWASAWVPALPLLSLTGAALERRTDVAAAILTGGWLLLILFAAEIYAVCLHREAWIPEFEPHLLDEDQHPLGAPASRTDDARVQRLFRALLIYGTGAAAPGLLVAGGSPVVLLAMGIFAAKFFAFSSIAGEFEVAVHWHMHCRVLDLKHRPHLTRWWEFVMDWYLGPLNGYVPRMYNANHLLVHHPENSGPDDIHSPLPFNRSSYLEFCIFAVQMIGSLLIGIDIAFHKRCRRRHRRMVLRGVACFWTATILFMSSRPTLAAWLIFAVLHRAVTAARSQYVWHGLIDPAGPYDALRTSILWVPSRERWDELLRNDGPRLDGDYSASGPAAQTVPIPGTDWAFYDNEHLIHHLHPRAHYTQYPALLRQRLPDIVAARSAVLEMREMPRFAYDCWSGDVDRIAASLLTETGDEQSSEFVRQRLMPLTSRRHAVSRITSTHFARRAEHKLTLALRPLITS